LLLDVVVFLVNVFLMNTLMRRFVDLVNDANEGDDFAQLMLFAGCIGVAVLPPLGATLKRWHFHQRLKREGKEAKDKVFLGGCFFNPIFYFCLTVVIFSAINAFVFQKVYGRSDPGQAVAVTSVFAGFILMLTHTFLVYRYFSPPKQKPKWKFLRDPRSELLGDVCIFVNMLLFQLGWNMLTLIQFDRVSSLLDFAGRLFFLSFLALLIYFPPRMFYLYEDIKRWQTWAMILLANSPVIVKIILGTPGEAGW